MKYALIVAGYALILWGIYTVRREAGRGRAAAYRDGQAEIEAVVEEFIAVAERVRADLDRKSAELQRLINLADDRLAKLIQAQAPVAVAAPAEAPAGTPAAPASAAPAAGTAASGQPALATRGAAAVAASYRAQLPATPGAAADQRAQEEQPARAEDDERPEEVQSVRATLTGDRADGKGGKVAKGTKAKAGGKERSRHAQVYELADSGQGVTEIARATGLSKGEVQLILDLRKTR